MEDELKLPLAPYQEHAKDFILHTPRCGLFLDCGLGKTLITLSAIYDLNPNGHVLVIAPKTVARAGWSNEIKKWGIPIRHKSLIVNERDKKLTKPKRLERYNAVLSEQPTMYFINRDLVVDLVKFFKQVGYWPFPIVVIDELHSFKSYSAERFKALKSVQPCFQRLIGLTGTPTPNGLMDLWSEIYLMDAGMRLGPNITSYREAFFTPGLYVNNHPVNWKIRPGMDDEIHRRISDIVISMKNTLIKLPEITYNNVSIPMTQDEKALYKAMMKEQVIEFVRDQVKEDGTDTDVVIAKNRAVLAAKLSQMASGTIYVDGNKEYRVIHENKLDYCEHIVETTGSPVIIAYHFKSDEAELKKRFPDAKVFDGSVKMTADWNDGKIPVMLLQPAANGTGANLQEGGHTLIWYTLYPNLEHYTQTIARIYRQGQENHVVIHHLMSEGTVDERNLHLLHVKDQTQENLMRAVLKDIQGIIGDYDA